MDRNVRLLSFVISLTLLLPLSVGLAYASKPPGLPEIKTKHWSGLQTPDPNAQGSAWLEGSDVVVSGSGMLVTSGYSFVTDPGLDVDYEMITELRFSMFSLGADTDGILNIYDYPHSGDFVWEKDGFAVATGSFSGDGSFCGGTLHAEGTLGGSEFTADGTYEMKKYVDIPIALLPWPVEFKLMLLYYKFTAIRTPTLLAHHGTSTFTK